MTRTVKLLVVPLIVLQVVFFGFIARQRFIDGDEGSYLLAARLVLMHKTPSIDFFWNQAPLLPYAYALWMKGAGISWDSGRAFSVLLTTLLGVLLYLHVCAQTHRWLAGVSAVVLFASSTLVFAWFSVVKTYSLSGLLLFCAYVAVRRLPERSPRWPGVLGGLLFGLSIDARSYLLLLAPLFLWWILKCSADRTRQRSVIGFLAGLAIGLVPSLLIFLRAPGIFLFDNLGYHALRSSDGLIGWWLQKLFVIAQLFLGSGEANGLQWSIPFVLSMAFVLTPPRRGYSPRLAFQIVLLLGFICLLPTPAYVQYFSVCVPFLIVSTVCVVSEFLARLTSKRERLFAGFTCLVLMAIYLAAGSYDLRKYLFTGDGIPGLRTALDKSDWRLERVIEVSRAVDEIANPGEVVASFWPGDIFQSKAAPFPGLENPFALPVAEKLTARQRVLYSIISPGEILSDFAANKPRVVVLRNQVSSAVTAADLPKVQRLEADIRSSLAAHGYNVIRSIGGISIYVSSRH